MLIKSQSLHPLHKFTQIFIKINQSLMRNKLWFRVADRGCTRIAHENRKGDSNPIDTLLNLLAFPNAFFGSSSLFMPNFRTSQISKMSSITQKNPAEIFGKNLMAHDSQFGRLCNTYL